MSETYAARYCKEYIFLHGAQSYLPALGEWYEVYQNKTEVNACMSLIGGKALFDNSIPRRWSSTQYDSNQAWYLYYDSRTIYTKKDYFLEAYVRPFAAF